MHTTFKDILDVFFRYAYHVIIFSIIICITTLMYIYGTKKIYTSSAHVLIRLGQEQMGSMQFMSNARNVYITRREQELKNEEMIFVSDQVITAAAQSILGDKSENIKALTTVKKYLVNKLKVKALFDSDTLSITFEFPDPYVAQRVLEILLEKYVEHHLNVYENIRELKFIKFKLGESRQNYNDALNKYTELTETVHIYDEKQIMLLLEKSNLLRAELSNTKAEYEYHVQKLAKSKEELKSLTPYAKFNSVEVINDRRNKLMSKLNEAMLEKENLLQKYTLESRLVLDVNKEIEMLKKLIANEPERVVDSIDNRKNDIYWTIEQNIVDLKTVIAGEKGKIDTLTQELQELDQELARNTRDYQHLALLKKDLDLAKNAYEKYHEGFLESDLGAMSRADQVTNISIIDHPSFSILPDRPNKKKIFLFSGAFFVAGNMFLLMMLVALNSTAANPNDLVKQLGQRPLVTIPFAQELYKNINLKSSKEVSRAGEGDHGADFSYFRDHLRDFQKFYVNLTHVGQDEKIFLIGRSYSGEGGVTICFNLAAFMSEYIGKKVAFVDYHSSRVSLEAGFQSRPQESFAHKTWNHVDCYRYEGEKIFNPHKLKEKYTILNTLRDQYDYVFCNIQPTKDFADLVFLNNHVDRVLFFVEAERTKVQVVKYNMDILAQYGFSKISLILNKRRLYIPKFLYPHV